VRTVRDNGIGDTADLLSSEGFSHTRGNDIVDTAHLLSSEGFSRSRGNGDLGACLSQI
jgi:hypothetical protein